MDGMHVITKKLEISGAHCLRLPYDSPCKFVHGHNWLIEVSVAGSHLHPTTGMIMDFKIIGEVVKRLDHQNLNDLFNFNPTAENIAEWIAEEIQNKIDTQWGENKFRPRVSMIKVQESEGNNSCFMPSIPTQ